MSSPITAPTGRDVEEQLRDTDTLAFLVVHGGRLVSEPYVNGAQRDTLQMSFSVAKSFLSTLVGIAIDDGSDPQRHGSSDRLRPGVRRNETCASIRSVAEPADDVIGEQVRRAVAPPAVGDDVNTYYGTDLRDLALNGTEIERAPGQEWHYNN